MGNLNCWSIFTLLCQANCSGCLHRSPDINGQVFPLIYPPTHLSTINKLMHSIKIINRITEHVQFVFRTGSFVPAGKDKQQIIQPPHTQH